MVNIETVVLNEVYTNCYLLTDEKTGEMAVIDPGFYSAALTKRLDLSGKKLKYILLTHGHYDHILYVSELKNRYGGEVCISKVEKPLVENGSLNAMISFYEIKPFDIDIALDDNDCVYLGDQKIEFMLTPGHTKGSGIYIMDDVIFSGDTVFCRSIGRTDLPTGDQSEMFRSLERISKLPGDYTICPGHDRKTTLEYERKYNPYFP